MADIITGGNGTDSKVSVLGKDGEERIQLIVTDTLTRIDTGTRDRPGSLIVRGKDGFAAFTLETRGGNESLLLVGRDAQPGRLAINNSQNDRTVQMTGADATLQLGGSGTNGTVSVRGKDGQPLVELLGRDNESVIGLGQSNRPGRISLYSGSGQEALRLDGASGDIVLMNADCAEEFDLAQAGIEPGTVMVLCDEGTLKPSEHPYDKRVAGVISGAGNYRPGIVLDKQPARGNRSPVALLGKVFCKVDASYAAIKIGDLLTTSDNPGHAMKATDPLQAFGAVIGKALRPLNEGQRLIPILIALQ